MKRYTPWESEYLCPPLDVDRAVNKSRIGHFRDVRNGLYRSPYNITSSKPVPHNDQTRVATCLSIMRNQSFLDRTAQAPRTSILLRSSFFFLRHVVIILFLAFTISILPSFVFLGFRTYSALCGRLDAQSPGIFAVRHRLILATFCVICFSVSSSAPDGKVPIRPTSPPSSARLPLCLGPRVSDLVVATPPCNDPDGLTFTIPLPRRLSEGMTGDVFAWHVGSARLCCERNGRSKHLLC